MQVEGLTVAYDGKPILRSVSFEASRGKLVGIIGPNGAGKSTLLKAILGLLRSDSGRVVVMGESIAKSRRHVAYVPQTESVDWDFPVTVFEVVLMGRFGTRAWWSRPGTEDYKAAEHALELVDMKAFSNRHIRRLSGGQQQRVFLARALCQQAPVMLLDEPFAGVDAATEQAIFKLMEELVSSGRTLLVVNHDLAVLERFDELLMLNQRVVAFGPTSQVLTQENLRRTYGGRLALLEQADTLLRKV